MAEGARTPTATHRPLRPLMSTAAVALGVLGLLGAFGHAFCGTALPSIQEVPDMEGCITMGTRRACSWSRMWTGGRPNKAMIKASRMRMPSLNNLKDQYFIIYARSPAVKQWCPMNIVNLYKQRDEITEQARKMHKGLRFSGELQFGYKDCRLPGYARLLSKASCQC
eukprot:Skav223611  [mRNA]  locus=scaffold1522:53567:57452:- [translate_table: standard]